MWWRTLPPPTAAYREFHLADKSPSTLSGGRIMALAENFHCVRFSRQLRRRDNMALSNRTILGAVLAIGILAGLTSVALAVLLMALAAFLIAWGQEPQRTEELIGRLPFSNHLLRALAQFDAILSSR
jgi:uncharacterized membrane protein YphA (DoxX/SURF4 family)